MDKDLEFLKDTDDVSFANLMRILYLRENSEIDISMCYSDEPKSFIDLVLKEIHSLGEVSLTNVFGGNFSRYRDIVSTVCKKIDLDTEDLDDNIAEVERRVLIKLLGNALDGFRHLPDLKSICDALGLDVKCEISNYMSIDEYKMVVMDCCKAIVDFMGKKEYFGLLSLVIASSIVDGICHSELKIENSKIQNIVSRSKSMIKSYYYYKFKTIEYDDGREENYNGVWGGRTKTREYNKNTREFTVIYIAYLRQLHLSKR